MLDVQDKLVLDRFKRLFLKHQVLLQSLVLFGSRARGEAGTESDYDVLVVVDHLDKQLHATISRCAWEAGFEDCLLIVPAVVTKEAIEESP